MVDAYLIVQAEADPQMFYMKLEISVD